MSVELDQKKRPDYKLHAQDLWYCDGSLRDIYIEGTTTEDWDNFLLFVQARNHSYLYQDTQKSLPNSCTKIFENRSNLNVLLEIKLNLSQINCHFFIPNEIELDINPREIQTQEAHEEILEFIELLSHSVGKAILLTPENSQEDPILKYSPDSQLWNFYRA